MRPLGVLCALVVISSTVGQVDSPAPGRRLFHLGEAFRVDSFLGCAISCWENTKYVSKCLNDIACLCSEPGYQNVGYIHPQCTGSKKLIPFRSLSTSAYTRSVTRLISGRLFTTRYLNASQSAIK
jgi:hypothetical protein